jgi:hypothetical protein
MMPDGTRCSAETASDIGSRDDRGARIRGVIAISYLFAFIALSSFVILELERISGTRECAFFGRQDCVRRAAASPLTAFGVGSSALALR